MPRAYVEAVITAAGFASAPAPVVVVRGGGLAEILVIARYRPRPVLEPAPRGAVAAGELRGRTGAISEVAGGEDLAR